MEKVICTAIERRLILQFSYKGVTSAVEPHALGYSKSDKLTLCAWQLSGGSGVGWRDYIVSEMISLSTASEHFDTPRPDYHRNDTTMTQILCQL